MPRSIPGGYTEDLVIVLGIDLITWSYLIVINHFWGERGMAGMFGKIRLEGQQDTKLS